MRFRLHKWYLDCVTPSGEVAIVYSARLSWGALKLGYAALILAEAGRAPTCTQVWRSCPPLARGPDLLWGNPRLGGEGSWTGLAPLPEIRLHEGVHWRCRQPGGPARLRLASGRELHGLGYAEELRLEVAPWNLPFRELRWGRFIPDQGGPALAWIQWREGVERGWCFRDGHQIPLASCGPDSVEFPGGRIALQRAGTVRGGSLLRSILGPAAALVPGPLRGAHEEKEIARGSLDEAAGIQAGWVIHERVRMR